MTKKKIGPIHPGEILREDFMKPVGLTPIKVAKLCGVPRTRIERVVSETTGITADTALRLGKLFDTTPGFWMNLQARYDLERATANLKDEIGRIKAIETEAG